MAKAFIEYLNDIDNVYENIDECNPNQKSKALIVFDENNKKSIYPILTELSNSCRKLNVSLAFTVQSYFAVPKNIKLNFTHYSFTKVPNKREFQQIAVNYSSDIAFKDFMNLDKECTKK